VRLDLTGITAGYGDTVALRDVDLVVPEGRVAALLGPNGAGKTTLLSVTSGLLQPTAGKVVLGDEEVTSLSPDQRVHRGLCHITEGRSVFPGLTVADNLRMFAAPDSDGNEIERAVSAFPRLGERLGQAAGTMSGGEQQMLALSRAYVQQAPLVLLDEVSMGLAPIIVDEIFEFLRGLADAGHSLLLVEQYAAKALELADIVYVLVRGRTVFAGEPGELVGTDLMAHYLGAETGELAGAQ
jgi:branched-chain amino acid transport system ATP-binding protein